MEALHFGEEIYYKNQSTKLEVSSRAENWHPLSAEVDQQADGLRFHHRIQERNENRAADALSRQPGEEREETLYRLTGLDPMWLQELRTSYKTNMELVELCQKLQ